MNSFKMSHHHLLIFFLCVMGSGALENHQGDIGDELEIECQVEGDVCLFVSAEGRRVCQSLRDSSCDRVPGIDIKKFNDVCRITFFPLKDEHYGKWSCQDKAWHGSIETTKSFEITPLLDIFVELTHYFGDVYFKRGDGLNVSCNLFLDSDDEYEDYPGRPLQWVVGGKAVTNLNPITRVDDNEWVQVLNYEPSMKDNHQRLSCFLNENINGQADGINLHMIDFEFLSDFIRVELPVRADESMDLEVSFKSYPEPRNQNVMWRLGGSEVGAGEISSMGMASSQIEEALAMGSQYRAVRLHIPPGAVESKRLLQGDNYFAVDLPGVQEPFKLPIVFTEAQIEKEEEVVVEMQQDLEFRSNTMNMNISENSRESLIMTAEFKSDSDIREENVVWMISGNEIIAGETSSLGISSSGIEDLPDGYKSVRLTIPSESIAMEQLLSEKSYLSIVEHGKEGVPLRLPILFQKSEGGSSGVVHREEGGFIPRTVNKLSNSSLIGYVLGGIAALLLLTCCVAYYIYKCCCGSDNTSDEHEGHYTPNAKQVKVLQPLALKENGYSNKSELGYSAILEPDDSEYRKLTWDEVNGSAYTERFNPSYRPSNSKVDSNIEGIQTRDEVSQNLKQSTPKNKSIFYTDMNIPHEKGRPSPPYSVSYPSSPFDAQATDRTKENLHQDNVVSSLSTFQSQESRESDGGISHLGERILLDKDTLKLTKSSPSHKEVYQSDLRVERSEKIERKYPEPLNLQEASALYDHNSGTVYDSTNRVKEERTNLELMESKLKSPKDRPRPSYIPPNTPKETLNVRTKDEGSVQTTGHRTLSYFQTEGNTPTEGDFAIRSSSHDTPSFNTYSSNTSKTDEMSISKTTQSIRTFSNTPEQIRSHSNSRESFGSGYRQIREYMTSPSSIPRYQKISEGLSRTKPAGEGSYLSYTKTSTLPLQKDSQEGIFVGEHSREVQSSRTSQEILSTQYNVRTSNQAQREEYDLYNPSRADTFRFPLTKEARPDSIASSYENVNRPPRS